jgi:hypothetical protein
VAGVVAVAAAGGCAALAAPRAPTVPAGTTARPAGARPGAAPARRRIVSAATLADLLAHDQTGIVRKTFDTPTTFVVITTHLGVPAGWVSVPVQSFTSEQTLAQTMSGAGPLPGVKAVLYDAESWSFTPPAEQRDPATYYGLAAQVAHAHGLALIATPAMDLASASRQTGETLIHAYLRLRIPAAAASHADLFEVQSQSSATDPTAFAALLSDAAAQAQQANPGVAVLGGLTTNHDGTRFTATQLVTAIHAAPAAVTGYWMNDPAGGSYCPKCTGPYPQTVIDTLGAL